MPDEDWKKYERLRGLDLPATLQLSRGDYALEKLFKNDFYAATGVYRAQDSTAAEQRVTYKVYHTDPCRGVPLAWLGRWLAAREIGFHQTLLGVEGVPQLLERHGETGFVREFIAGRNLWEFHRTARPDREFFPRLENILAAIHQRGIAHCDLAKPENILVSDAGRPYLIDFQIALMHGQIPWGLRKPYRDWLQYQQQIDRYHIRKHYYRSRPEDLTPAMLAAAKQRGFWLNVHYHFIRNPYRAVRHFYLRNWLLKPGYEES